MPRYLLPPHVHFCARGDAIVFLDLRRDEYLLLPPTDAHAIHALSRDNFCQARQSTESVHRLIQQGLLIPDCENGRPIAPTRVDLALHSILELDGTLHEPARASDFLVFVLACAKAATILRFAHIETTTRYVANRKRRASLDRPFEMSRAKRLTTLFLRWRALVPRSHFCLFDSLALLEFLAHYELFPTWVFGIKLEPWSAHCWVQEAGVIFDEGVEEAASYTPIMSI